MFEKRYVLASIVGVLVIGLLLISGCGPAHRANFGADVVKADSNEVMMGTVDNGGRADLAEGEVLVITLESNPTTGYSWQIAAGGGSVLQQIGEAEFSPQSDLMGAPGVETFRFEAASSGQAELSLLYQRPWEKDVEPLQTFSLQVFVQ